MAEIVVDPQELDDISARFSGEGERVKETLNKLRDAVSGLDMRTWTLVEDAQIGPKFLQAEVDGFFRVSKRAQLGDTLARVADAFRQTDATAVRQIIGLPDPLGIFSLVTELIDNLRENIESMDPPWVRDGYEWWAEAFEKEHGRPPTRKEYQTFRLSWALSGEGQVEWTDADWEAFHHARQAGLADWIDRGVAFAGAWSGVQVLAAVEALNAVQETWGDDADRVLGLEDGLAIEPPAAGEQFTLLPVLGETLNPGFDRVKSVGEYTAAGGTIEYKLLEGQTELFIDNGDGTAIHESDITQKNVGDCYFMSSLAALARTPEGRTLIQNNLRANPDGTYTVTFYERNPDTGEFAPVEVTITPEFPVDENGGPFFARQGDVIDAGTSIRSDDRVEIWTLVYEKAYAQHMGDYQNIVGGWGAGAMETLTGQPGTGYIVPTPDLPVGIAPGDLVAQHYGSTTWVPETIVSGMSFNEMETYFNNGYAVTAASFPIPEGATTIEINRAGFDLRVNPLALLVSPLYDDKRVMGCHEYYVVDMDPATQEVILRNPHGYNQGEIQVSWDEFRKAFPLVSVNPIGP